MSSGGREGPGGHKCEMGRQLVKTGAWSTGRNGVRSTGRNGDTGNWPKRGRVN